VKLRVRFSLNNLKLDDDVLNIPLFLADQTDRMIGWPWSGTQTRRYFFG
jgi:hypothetical protein